MQAHVWAAQWADRQLARAIEREQWSIVVVLVSVVPGTLGYLLGWLFMDALVNAGVFDVMFLGDSMLGLDLFIWLVDWLALVPFALRPDATFWD